MRKRPLSQLALPIILIFCSCFAFANSKVDSLKQLLNKSIQDTSRLSILFELNKAFGKEKDSSLYYLNRAYELAEATNQPDAQVKALLDMGLIYHNRQAYPEAKTRLLKALSLARQYKLENRLPYVYLDLGNTYRRLMKTDSAIYAYQQSIKNFEKIEETYDTWKPIFNIGRVYMVLEDIERAKNYMTRAFAIVKDSDNRMDRGYLIFFLAELYRKLEDFDGYFDMLQEWERFQKEKNKNEVQLNEFAHLTMFAMFTKDDSLVIKNYRDAIDYFKEKANYFRLGWSYHDLGQIHFNRENYDTAQSLFQKALENFQLNQNTERIAGTLLKLYQTEKVLNNFPQALSYLEQHEALKDSLNLHEMKQHMARLEVEFETEKKEQRLALQALDIRQKTAQRNLFLGSSLLLAILALTIFFALRNRIRLNRKIANQEAALQTQKIKQLEQEKQLMAFNSMLEGQEKERLRIAKDLHDSLGGLLTTVKAHFNALRPGDIKPKSDEIYAKTNKLIDEANVEVRRISHNMVPKALTVSGLKGALEDLVENLETNGIRCKLELISMEEDIPQPKALTLFRAIQELTNNILKHAEAENVLIQLINKNGQLTIFVEDDGKGFNFQQARAAGGIGLENIESRIRFLHGKINWDSVIDEGTTVNIQIPLDIQQKNIFAA